jgi:hypothetical protein
MHTITLRAIKHPSRVAVLLRELVHTFNVLPKDAYEVCDGAKLPPALRRFTRCAAHLNASWACWMDGAGNAWFFFAEMPLELSRERGVPVLQLDRYGDDGAIVETGRWMRSSDGIWRRVSAAAP